MSKQMAPISVRLTQEMKDRLEAAAKAIGIAPHSLASLAVEAGIIAIEKGDGKLVLPLEFEVTHEAVPKSGSRTSYSSHKPSSVFMNDADPTKPAAKKRRAA